MPEKPDKCPCKRMKCPRHGDCDACKRYHAGKKYPPVCLRVSKTDKPQRPEERP